MNGIVVVLTARGSSFFLRAHLLSFRCNMGKIRREIVCTKVWLKKVKRNLRNCKNEIKKISFIVPTQIRFVAACVLFK